ncbi:BppU family phage baseplate upper protein [Companilactobacillus mishanensis]|uniref:DUF2479 domain-containing protein n=1 Tax=Companilactobacillus mishanensis TaxID=2486008 RepID=A0A5P0ZGN6_9LACO|nr:BppU family phage baseplate upper protein [Companilactobacillus mishanensis]MQS52179.1 DUF2479 domain-containing protein [Companilactobacillus mishanensis]
MANRYPITLDVNKSKYTINTPVTLREGDGGTATIVATILDNGYAYSGMTSAKFFAQKPDGTVVANDTTSVSGNTITYTVNKNMSTTSGYSKLCYFQINGSVSTESFEVHVQPGLILHGPSQDYIPGLNDLQRVWQDTIKEWETKFTDLKNQVTNTDYSEEIKTTMNEALAEAKVQYQKDFNNAIAGVNDTIDKLNAKGVEADTAISDLKKQQAATQTVADSLQDTVDALNKKITDVDAWLDSLHDEFSKTNEAYMKSMQAELTQKLATMKASSDSALSTVKGNISSAQSDIIGIDKRITDLTQTFEDVSASVDSINIPQIKEDVDTANANANQALSEVDSKASTNDLIQLATDLVNDNLVTVYGDGGAPVIPQLKTPTLNVSPSDGQVAVTINDSNTAGVVRYSVEYTSGSTWTTKSTTGKSLTITGLTNGTIYKFRVKAIGNETDYNDSNYSTNVSATPAKAPATKLKTPTIKVTVSGTTISYTITDSNTAGVKNYSINGVGSEKTVTGKTGTLTGSGGTTYSVKVKAVSSDVTTYTDSDYSTAVSAVIPVINPTDPKDSDFSVSVTDTTATITDNNTSVDRSEEYLFITQNGGGQVAISNKGEKTVTLTGLTPETKYSLGAYWLAYRNGANLESGKVAVPEFTTSGSGSTVVPESMNIDWSVKKQGDNLPYKAYIVHQNYTSPETIASEVVTGIGSYPEMSDEQYKEISSDTKNTYINARPSWVENIYDKVLVEIKPQKFPSTLTLEIPTISGIPTSGGIGQTSNGGNYVITPNYTSSFVSSYSGRYSKYTNVKKHEDSNQFDLSLESKDSDLLYDGSVWILISYSTVIDGKMATYFYWDPTQNTITYPAPAPVSLTSLDTIQPMSASLVMAPMALSTTGTIQRKLSETFVKRDEMTSYVPATQLAEYATSVEIANQYISKSDVATNYVKKTDLDSYALKTALSGYVPTSKLSSYSTTTQMNSAISSAVNGMMKSADVQTLITTALKDYLKTANLSAENIKAGFFNDWTGTESQYTALTSKSATTTYHVKEE